MRGCADRSGVSESSRVRSVCVSRERGRWKERILFLSSFFTFTFTARLRPADGLLLELSDERMVYGPRTLELISQVFDLLLVGVLHFGMF